MSIVDRILNAAGDHDILETAAKVDSIRPLLILYAAAQAWNSLLLHTGLPTGRPALVLIGLAALGLSACFAASLMTRFGAWAPRVALGLLVLQFVVSQTGTTGHLVLALWCLLFVVLFDGDEDHDRLLVLQGLQWTAALLIFGCGVQKLLAGTWFQGDFAAFAIATGQPLGDLFAWTLPAAEIERLREIDFNLAGSGPVRTGSWAFVTLSNLVWLVELALPVALLFQRKTRSVIAAVSILFVLVFYLAGCREPLWSFAMTSLLLLFAPKAWIERAFFPIVFLYLYVLGMSIGVLPGAGSLRLALVPGRVHL